MDIRPLFSLNPRALLPPGAVLLAACGGGPEQHRHDLEDHVHAGSDVEDGAFAAADHTHVPGSVDADLLDGLDSTELSLAGHTHAPVVWVGADSVAAAFLDPFTYVADRVEVDTTSGHLTMGPDGVNTVNTAGIYRVRAWAVATCSSILESECRFDQTLLRNGARVERSFGTVPILPGPAELKLDSEYLGDFAVGDTFSVEYDCSLGEAVFGTNECSLHSSDGGNGLQVEYLGAP